MATQFFALQGSVLSGPEVVRTTPQAHVEIRLEADGTLVPLFTDYGGTISAGNPVLCDDLGEFLVYLEAGIYRIRIYSAEHERTLRHYLIGNVSSYDITLVEEARDAAEAARDQAAASEVASAESATAAEASALEAAGSADAAAESASAAASAQNAGFFRPNLLLDGNNVLGPSPVGTIPPGWAAFPLMWSIVDLSTTPAASGAPTQFGISIPAGVLTGVYAQDFSCEEGALFRAEFWAWIAAGGTGARFTVRYLFWDASGAQIGASIDGATTGALDGDDTWALYRGTIVVAPVGTVKASVHVSRDLSGRTAQMYAAGLASDMVTPLQMATRAWLNGTVSPMMFGTIGDGSANDTVALQRAADFARAWSVPLTFRPEHFYLVDHVDFGDDCDLRGRAQIISSGFDVQTNLPSQRHVVRIGKRGRGQEIEYQHSVQTGYESDPTSSNFGTGIAGQLLLDDDSDVDLVELTGTLVTGGPICTSTCHGGRIGMFRSDRKRVDPTGPLIDATSANGLPRPFTGDGQWSRDGVQIARTDYLQTPSNVGVGFRMDGYRIRFAWRGIKLNYADDFQIGPGEISGLHDQTVTDVGYNGWLIGSCRNGVIAAGEVSDCGEHAIRIASNDRRGCWDLTFGRMTIKRQGASAVKINGGGGAGVHGADTSDPANNDAELTRTKRIRFAPLLCIDPFADIPIVAAKAQELIRISHAEGVHFDAVQIEHEDSAVQTGSVLAINSARGVYVGPVKSATNAHIEMRAVNFDASNDTDPYDILQDTVHVHLNGWDARKGSIYASYIRIQMTSGVTGVVDPSIGHVRLTDWQFYDAGPLSNVVSYTAATDSAIFVDGVVRQARNLTWMHPGESYGHVVQIVDLAGAASSQKFGQAHVALDAAS